MYRQSEKNLLSSNISSICPHNMVNLGPVMAEIDWRIWGTPANFNGFCVLALLLHHCCSTEVNHTLHDVWPSPGLVHYIYIFGGSCPITEFCLVQNLLCVQVSYLSSVTARHSSSGCQPNFVAWYNEWNYGLLLLIICNRGRHLYSEGGHRVGHRPTF